MLCRIKPQDNIPIDLLFIMIEKFLKETSNVSEYDSISANVNDMREYYYSLGGKNGLYRRN